ncbi:unnamed protein product, partial [Porites lobata]
MYDLLKCNAALQTRSALNLVCPRYNRESEGGRSFSVSATRLWNSLPIDLKRGTCVTSFRKAIYICRHSLNSSARSTEAVSDLFGAKDSQRHLSWFGKSATGKDENLLETNDDVEQGRQSSQDEAGPSASGEQGSTRVEDSALQVKTKLEEEFPKLKNRGGFEILRSGFSPGKSLVLLRPPASAGYSVKFLRDESGLGQALAYIRPLQR